MNGRLHKSPGPSLDFQTHLAQLESKGLLVRVDQPINKDTELHPLVRCQFLGSVPEDEGRAFLFTNVVDSQRRRYDIPVVVGALAASPTIYSVGMGCAVEDIGDAWTLAIANPIEPILVNSPLCQEIVIRGDDLRRPGGGLASLPVPVSSLGFDSAPYLTATLCITRDPETGVRNMGTYRAALKKTDRLGVRMSSRIGGAGGYLHWQKYRTLGKAMPCAIVIGCAPVVIYTGPQKRAVNVDEIAVAGGAAGAPIRMAKCVTVDLEVPADSEIVIEGLIDSVLLEPEGPFGESNGYVALEDYNMIMQVRGIRNRGKEVFGCILRKVKRREWRVIKKVVYEEGLMGDVGDKLWIKGI